VFLLVGGVVDKNVLNNIVDNCEAFPVHYHNIKGINVMFDFSGIVDCLKLKITVRITFAERSRSTLQVVSHSGHETLRK
jgi:hypothetical protein